jgi:hypothetical protein
MIESKCNLGGLSMTTLLHQAFNKASSLPAILQDELAQELMDEIEWEMQWDKTLERTKNQIDILAKQALDEYYDGKTIEKGIDEV